MALNILETLQSEFNDEIVGQLGRFVGEDSGKTKAALGSILPALLSVLASKATSSQGAAEILNMITKGGFGASPLAGLSSAVMGEESANTLLNSGRGLLDAIFGNRLTRVIDWISGSSGVGKSAASSLLALAVPVVLGFLGKEVKSSHLDANGLGNLLAGQAGYLKKLAPAGLADALGLSGFAPGIGSAPRGSPLWKLLIPLIIIIGFLLFLFRTCNAPPVEEAAEKAEKAPPAMVTEEVSRAAMPLGAFLPVRLPNGVELNVPEFGIERKLIAFIEDTSRPVDDTTWFSFDRLEFETGSAILKPSSTEQLNNIAEIMRAYPQVNLKIGGYTDNVGNPAANLTLSQHRAENTMQELIRSGIDAARLEAEGYGEDHPVADNTTEEGRQRNRRIDVRVTKK